MKARAMVGESPTSRWTATPRKDEPQNARGNTSGRKEIASRTAPIWTTLNRPVLRREQSQRSFAALSNCLGFQAGRRVVLGWGLFGGNRVWRAMALRMRSSLRRQATSATLGGLPAASRRAWEGAQRGMMAHGNQGRHPEPGAQAVAAAADVPRAAAGSTVAVERGDADQRGQRAAPKVAEF